MSGLVPTVGEMDMTRDAPAGPDCAGVMSSAIAHHSDGPFGPGTQVSGTTYMPASERGPQN